MLTLALTLLTQPAQAEDVLVLWDSLDQDTPGFVAALESAGVTVALADVPEWQWDGTNPSLDGFATVIHLDGSEAVDGNPAAYESSMPVAGQAALVAFVGAGGGYIHQEWMAYELGSHTAMQELILLRRSGGREGEVTVNVATAQRTHPVWTGVPDSFSMESGVNVGNAAPFTSDPVTVLATDADGSDAVVVREITGGGRIVGFHHSGNYLDYGTLADPNVRKLYVNAVRWTVGCDVDGDGELSVGACGGTDCDDSDPLINTGAAERCNGVDNDCDGFPESPDPVDGDFWYLDGDDDGYGNAGDRLLACDQPDGYVDNGTDCDDGDDQVNPGESEIPYDGVDNDCADGDLCDVDDDGVDAEACGGTDCDDDDDGVAPGEPEVWYDGIDQDCDGIDDDQDGDGFGIAEDCDDTDATVYPGADEIGGDGIDNDCDGKVDGCSCQSGPAGGAWLIPGLLGLLLLRRRTS
jgi:MYXO-CTERM domain-containing protein